MSRASAVRRVAIGDPQAPLETFFAVLDAYSLRAPGGQLRDDVHLVSVGDHFDYGGAGDRARAAHDGTAILKWLASHPPEQVTILAGNHDLARVGELARFDDATFAAAQVEADVVYAQKLASVGAVSVDRVSADAADAAEAAFLARHPDVPTAECVARDFASFRAEQRDLVLALLRAGRMRLAFAAADDFLLTHAGVTIDDLEALGVPASAHADAPRIAHALDGALAAAVGAFDGAPLVIAPELHRPGSAAFGEGRGILYHRPSQPNRDGHEGHEAPELFLAPRRRFDPRRLPRGLTQAIGHIQDTKCRSLLRDWAVSDAAPDGALRHLVTDGAAVGYAVGAGDARESARNHGCAAMLFLDGGMRRADPARYELCDLDSARALLVH